MATQIAGAEGMGLMHGVERFAGAVWERHCPAEDQPPVWVERQLWPDLAEDDDDLAVVNRSTNRGGPRPVDLLPHALEHGRRGICPRGGGRFVDGPQLL
ncbi:hypothetical protein ACFYPZ_40070 [Streptomyces sp. NPDC005506]|uniref:hypothetical protein n=1 Tax=unclassified Streptomyces TaxID=2593676 RepID=UPI0036B8BA0D